MKFKKNQWVRIIADGKIGQVHAAYESGTVYVDVDGFCIINCFIPSELEPAPKTWETLEVGDVIVDKNGAEAIILAVIGDVLLRSVAGLSTQCANWYTRLEVQSYGWTLKEATSEPVEVTMADVEAKFGKKVKIIKGK